LHWDQIVLFDCLFPSMFFWCGFVSRKLLHDILMLSIVCRTSTPLNVFNVPRSFKEIWSLAPTWPTISLEISMSRHATAKLSTCPRNITFSPETVFW
jgi:hypothetical protein